MLSGFPECADYLDQLCVEHFFEVRNKTVYRALAALRRDGKPLDPINVHIWCRDHSCLAEAGGVAYISGLPDETHSSAAFPTFLSDLNKFLVKRSVLRDSGELAILARDPTVEPEHVREHAVRMLEQHTQSTAPAHRNGKWTLRKPAELLDMHFDDSDKILGDRIMATGQPIVIAGQGGIGKSRIVGQLAAACITGRDWFSIPTFNPNLNWLFLQAENNNRRVQMDMRAIRHWAGDDWEKVNSQITIHTLETDHDFMVNLDDADNVRRASEAIASGSYDVIVWDSLYNFGFGDLNQDQDMAATVQILSRLTKAGNPNRIPFVLMHSLTGKAGAIKATGYDRTSFGRNSKVINFWSRSQINVVPLSSDNNDQLLIACGKNNNGREFDKFGVRLNEENMIYEVDTTADLISWEKEISGKRERKEIKGEQVAEILSAHAKENGSPNKKDLAEALQDELGCRKSAAYEAIQKAVKSRHIVFTETLKTYTVA